LVADHTAKLREAWKPEPVIVTVTSSLPAVAVAGDSALIEGVVNAGGIDDGLEGVDDVPQAIELTTMTPKIVRLLICTPCGFPAFYGK
jgi:hypothetical protein